MGLTAPTVRASSLWPGEGALVSANASCWLHLQILGGAFAEVELRVDGLSRSVRIVERAPAVTPPHPGIPMPPGWTPQPGPGLFSIRAEIPPPVGASCRLTVRTLAGHDGPPPGRPISGPFAVRCASRPPIDVQHRSEPVLDLGFTVEPPRSPGAARLVAKTGASSSLGSMPGTPLTPAPPRPPGWTPIAQHTLELETEDAPVFVCWLAPVPESRIVTEPGTHRLVHDGDLGTLRVHVWSWAGVSVAHLEP